MMLLPTSTGLAFALLALSLYPYPKRIGAACPNNAVARCAPSVAHRTERRRANDAVPRFASRAARTWTWESPSDAAPRFGSRVARTAEWRIQRPYDAAHEAQRVNRS